MLLAFCSRSPPAGQVLVRLLLAAVRCLHAGAAVICVMRVSCSRDGAKLDVYGCGLDSPVFDPIMQHQDTLAHLAGHIHHPPLRHAFGVGAPAGNPRSLTSPVSHGPSRCLLPAAEAWSSSGLQLLWMSASAVAQSAPSSSQRAASRFCLCATTAAEAAPCTCGEEHLSAAVTFETMLSSMPQRQWQHAQRAPRAAQVWRRSPRCDASVWPQNRHRLPFTPSRMGSELPRLLHSTGSARTTVPTGGGPTQGKHVTSMMLYTTAMACEVVRDAMFQGYLILT